MGGGWGPGGPGLGSLPRHWQLFISGELHKCLAKRQGSRLEGNAGGGGRVRTQRSQERGSVPWGKVLLSGGSGVQRPNVRLPSAKRVLPRARPRKAHHPVSWLGLLGLGLASHNNGDRGCQLPSLTGSEGAAESELGAGKWKSKFHVAVNKTNHPSTTDSTKQTQTRGVRKLKGVDHPFRLSSWVVIKLNPTFGRASTKRWDQEREPLPGPVKKAWRSEQGAPGSGSAPKSGTSAKMEGDDDDEQQHGNASKPTCMPSCTK
ncbi:hypothetical protein B0H63DRAFT_195225 [Podospora didyma]|uniref:Uncharacterized protein n=1 Tax=Podospora didyma TaxID=330526 RepID=A0AAE0NGD5_9PEZI|nr:hypothetical protein B0H63DRAFT_195225 [Podospora didyma]